MTTVKNAHAEHAIDRSRTRSRGFVLVFLSFRFGFFPPMNADGDDDDDDSIHSFIVPTTHANVLIATAIVAAVAATRLHRFDAFVPEDMRGLHHGKGK